MPERAYNTTPFRRFNLSIFGSGRWDGRLHKVRRLGKIALTRSFKTFAILQLAGVLVLVTSIVQADDDCDKALDKDIRNELHYEDLKTFRVDLNRSVFQSEEDLQKAKISGSLSVPIADFLLRAGAESEDVREYKSLVKIDERLAADSVHYRRIQAKILGEGAYVAWLECKKTQRDIILKVIGGSENDPDQNLIVNVEYMPKSAVHAKEVKIIFFGLDNAEMLGEGPLQSGAILKEFSGMSRICKRTSKKKVGITLDFDGYPSLVRELQKIDTPPPPPPTPKIISAIARISTNKENKEPAGNVHLWLFNPLRAKQGGPETNLIDNSGIGGGINYGNNSTHDVPLTLQRQEELMPGFYIAKVQIHGANISWNGSVDIILTLDTGEIRTISTGSFEFANNKCIVHKGKSVPDNASDEAKLRPGDVAELLKK